MSFKVDYKGIKALDAKLKKLPRKLGRRAVLNTLRPAARMVRDEIKSSSAFQDKTGAHRKSIKVVTARASDTPANVIAVKIKGDYKSNWLEYGTASMAAKPHFRPAADAKEAAAEKMIVLGLMAQINRVMN